MANGSSIAPVSRIIGGRRYPWNVDGSRALVKYCYSDHGRHAFVTGSRVEGPNVFYKSVSTNEYATPRLEPSTGRATAASLMLGRRCGQVMDAAYMEQYASLFAHYKEAWERRKVIGARLRSYLAGTLPTTAHPSFYQRRPWSETSHRFVSHEQCRPNPRHAPRPPLCV